jgi:putative ATP-dependent endonuclease of the OLD family
LINGLVVRVLPGSPTLLFSIYQAASNFSLVTSRNNSVVILFDSTDSTTNLLALDREDFHHKNTDGDVEITATFTDLNDQAQKKLAHYYRQGKLVVSAIARWNKDTNSAPVIQYGKREVMKAFIPFFEAHDNAKVKVDELRKRYGECRSAIPALPDESTKNAMYAALRAYEEAHPEECTLIDSEAEFYGGAGKAQSLLTDG